MHLKKNNFKCAVSSNKIPHVHLKKNNFKCAFKLFLKAMINCLQIIEEHLYRSANFTIYQLLILLNMVLLLLQKRYSAGSTTHEISPY